MTRRRPHITLAVACAFAGWVSIGCSLLHPDDLQLRVCEQNRDCYVLAQASHEAAACYQCVQGKCERRGSMRTRRLGMLESPAQRVVSTEVSPEQTILTVMTEQGLRGYRVDGDRDVEALGPPDYRYAGDELVSSVCPVFEEGHWIDRACRLREHAMTALSTAHWLGASINVSGCETGQLRVGLSGVDAPMTFDPRSAQGVIAGGVAVDDRGCTAASGASAPSIASLPTADEHGDALAVWLESAPASPSRPALDRCMQTSAPVPMRALPLRIHEAHGSARVEAVSSNAAPEDYGLVAAGTSPRVVALTAEGSKGFVVASAAQESVRLQTVDAGSFQRGAELTEPDSEVRLVRLAAATADGDAQDLLVAWLSGCTTPRLKVAVFRFRAGRLTRMVAPVTLHAGEMDASAISLAYTDHGFALDTPAGGWSVVWFAAGVAHEARIAHRSLEISRSRDLRAPGAVLAFVISDEVAPFSYGFATSSADTQDQQLMALICD